MKQLLLALAVLCLSYNIHANSNVNDNWNMLASYDQQKAEVVIADNYDSELIKHLMNKVSKSPAVNNWQVNQVFTEDFGIFCHENAFLTSCSFKINRVLNTYEQNMRLNDEIMKLNKQNKAMKKILTRSQIRRLKRANVEFN